MILGELFYKDLDEIIERYSGMEMTNAEAVGYLMFKANELMNCEAEEEVAEYCIRCGDELGHEEDSGSVCRWCNEGWVDSPNNSKPMNG